MFALNTKELAILWEVLLPDIPMPADYKTMVTGVVCYFVTRKYDIRDEADRQEIEARVSKMATRREKKKAKELTKIG